MQLQAEKTAANARQTSQKAIYNLPSIDNTRPSSLVVVINGRQFQINRRNQRLAVKTNERKGEFNIYKQTSTDSKLYSRYRRMFIILLACLLFNRRPSSFLNIHLLRLSLHLSFERVKHFSLYSALLSELLFK